MNYFKRQIAGLLAIVMLMCVQTDAYASAWQQINGMWFHQSNGQNDIGWISENADVWYYLNADGVMQTGWYQDEFGMRYYLNQADEGTEGQMRYGWYLDKDGVWYFLNTQHDGTFGKAITGWAWIDGCCYYFDNEGKMYASAVTPDGYTVDSDGHWVVDGVIQRQLGKGYESKHSHSAKVSSERGGSYYYSQGTGSSGSQGENVLENTDINKPYEEANKEVYTTLNNVKAFDNTTQEGKKEIEQLDSTILSMWISDLPETEDDFEEADEREIQLAVTNENPFFKYINSGDIVEGDIIYIPESENRLMPITLVYQSHDDVFSGGEIFDSESTEIIHTTEASMRQVFKDEIVYSAGGVNTEKPIAFSWFADETGIAEENEIALALLEIATSNNAKVAIATYGNAVRLIAANDVKEKEFGKVDFSYSTDPKTQKPYIKLELERVFYDQDGDSKTKNDQLKISGEYEMRDLTPLTYIDWPLLDTHGLSAIWLDYLPNQIMAMLYSNDTLKVDLEYSAKADMKDIVKAINKANGINDNEFDFGGIKLQGIDFDKTAILWAAGINVGTGQVQIGMNHIQDGSMYVPVAPVMVVMLVLDIDGNISVKCSAGYERKMYCKRGVNYQEKNYVGLGGTVSDNSGTNNIDLLTHMLNIYNNNQRSSTDKREPENKFFLKAEGSAEIDTSLNVGIGMMIAGLMPVAGKFGAGINAKGEGSAEIEIKGDQEAKREIEGSATLELYLKAQLLAKLKLKAGGFEFGLDQSPEWRWQLYRKEFTNSISSSIGFNSELPKYFDYPLTALGNMFVQKNYSAGVGFLTTYSLVNDSSVKPFSWWSEDGKYYWGDTDLELDIVEYGEDTTKEDIFEYTGGTLQRPGIYSAYAGVKRVFDGLDTNTTLRDVIDALSLKGRYGLDGEVCEWIYYEFEKDDYTYYIYFPSLYNEWRDEIEEDDDFGLVPADADIQKALNERMLNNDVFVIMNSTKSVVSETEDLDVYEWLDVSWNATAAVKQEACEVPSGEIWKNVIFLPEGQVYFSRYGRNRLMLELQVDASEFENLVLEISYDYNSIQEIPIHSGTNYLNIAINTKDYGCFLGISVKDNKYNRYQKVKTYIRNAVLRNEGNLKM